MTPTVVPASFRDPAGFVWTDGADVFRHVGEEHRTHYDALMSSGLYDALVEDQRMIAHAETDEVVSPRPDVYKVLKPEVVGFISYPYEWSFSQLKDAALLTLDVQKRALDHGMSLRDASAYNVQFHRGRPVLIDTLSFEVLPEGRPWIAYRQFCQHFLAPLALMAHVDIRLGLLLRDHIDGVPLDLASSMLPRGLRSGLFTHIHSQVRMQAHAASRPEKVKERERTFSLQAFRGILWSLEKAVRKLTWEPRGSWRDYYQESTHYSDRALEHKRQLVRAFVEEAGGSTVWDLGANTGLFARDAAELGRSVVCFDVDPACVELNYRSVKEQGETTVLPLVCDLTNPSPALGWANRERSSLAERGPADVVVALALLHHLAIGNNVPLDLIADFLAELGPRTVVEFVPKSDPMVQKLLSTRTDIFPAYTPDGFERSFERRFDIERREPLKDSDRTLYLMRRK